MNPTRRAALLLYISLTLSLSAQPSLKSARFAMPEGVAWIPGWVVVKFRTGAPPPALDAALAALKADPPERVFPHVQPPASPADAWGQPMADLSRIYLVKYTADLPIETAVSMLMVQEEVEYAEPWIVHQLMYQPNDPWADTTGGVDFIWYLDQVQARQAWDLARGKDSIVIGVVDSGTELDHADLQDNLARNTGDPPDGIDNDQDGYVDNAAGWDFGGASIGALGDNNPDPGTDVHGLWVTGIAGATTDNGIGIPGICFNCGYLPVKAAPDDSLGIVTAGYPGIVYAADQGAQIINCSWGSPFPSRLGQDVIQYATVNRRAAVVAACGNSTSDTRFYPASYSRVLSVANSSFGDALFANSTYNYAVDLSAPGTGIYSTRGNSGYWAWGGTSAASPVAAAAAALAMSHFPQLTGFQAAQRVRVTTDDTYGVNPAYTDQLGSGRLNVFRALSDPLRPSVRTLRCSAAGRDAVPGPGDTLTLDLALINYLHPAASLHVSVAPAGASQAFVSVLGGEWQAGPLGMMQSLGNSSAFRIRLSPALPYDQRIALKFTYVDAASGYTDFEIVEFDVNPSYRDLTASQLHTTLNSTGNFGFQDFPLNTLGIGARYRFRQNALFEGGFLAGSSNARVSDRLRNGSSRDSDWSISQYAAYGSSGRADQEITARYKDTQSLLLNGIEVRQAAYAFEDSAYQDFVLLEYVIRNARTTTLNNLFAGLYADWDISPYYLPGYSDPFTSNRAGFMAGDQLFYTLDVTGQDPGYYGLGLVRGADFRGRSVVNDGSFTYSNAEKFQALSNNPLVSAGEAGGTSGADVAQFISTGPFSLAAGVQDTAVFALLAGDSQAALAQARVAAQNAYRCRILNEGPNLPFLAADTLVAAGAPLLVSDPNPGLSVRAWSSGAGQSDTARSVSFTYSQPGTYEIRLQVSRNACVRTYTRTVTVSTAASGAGPDGAPAWRVYPNPARGVLHAAPAGAVAGPAEAELLDLAGRSLLQVRQPQGGPMDLPVAGLPAGLYLLRIRTAAGTAVLRAAVE
ncbi:MAG: S8 family serine peptidase [Bacteroidia bacterium]|nr:S8 family serine peptidase [Bacteroidia bacterium]